MWQGLTPTLWFPGKEFDRESRVVVVVLEVKGRTCSSSASSLKKIDEEVKESRVSTAILDLAQGL